MQVKKILKSISKNRYGKFVVNWILGILTFSPYSPSKFKFNNIFTNHFFHEFNTNKPPFRYTERTIELALADKFLKNVRGSVTEVGAVTPYYWPGRVKEVIDPMDKSPYVTNRIDWLEYEEEIESLLSISTFEHIGLDDYSLKKDPSKTKVAFQKLVQIKGDILCTFPGGYNNHLDQMVFELCRQKSKLNIYIFQRGILGNNWKQVDPKEIGTFNFSYGPFWANTLIVIHKGQEFIE
jgi:hypothetical protein